MAHRSIEERLEALQLQHARLLAVQAKKKLRNHPVMESLQSRLTEISNNNLKYARWETEWQEKVENFKQRVAEWIERGNVAQERMASARKQKKRVEGFIDDCVARIENGEDVTMEDYSIEQNMDSYES